MSTIVSAFVPYGIHVGNSAILFLFYSHTSGEQRVRLDVRFPLHDSPKVVTINPKQTTRLHRPRELRKTFGRGIRLAMRYHKSNTTRDGAADPIPPVAGMPPLHEFHEIGVLGYLLHGSC